MNELPGGHEPSAEPSILRKALSVVGVALLGAVLSACASGPPPLVLTGAAIDSAISTCNDLLDLPPRTLSIAAPLRRQGISGAVLVRVTVDAGGRVLHAKVARETPAVAALGDAALNVAKGMCFDNSLHRSVVFTVEVVFPHSSHNEVQIKFAGSQG